MLVAFRLEPGLAQEAQTEFEFSVDGELVDKLEAGMTITVSTLGTSKEFPCVAVSGRIEDLPLKLPVADLQNRYTRVKLADVKTGLLISFSVTKLKDRIKRFDL